MWKVTFPKINYRKGRRGWWVFGFPCGPIGPYPTKNCDEIKDDVRSMKRFFNDKRRKL